MVYSTGRASIRSPPRPPGMQRKLLQLIGIAFVVAILATGIFYGLIVNRLRSGSRAERSIVVAARELDRGTVLQKTDLKLIPWGGAETPKGSFATPDKLEGRTVLESVSENEPLTQARVASQESGGAALAIPAGMRAVSIRASDSAGVVSALRAGSRVDVQVYYARSGAEPLLRTVLQNIEVLSVPEAERGQSRTAPSVVTLLAKPAEAEILGLADSGAKIRLVLRNPIDSDMPGLAGLGVAGLFGRPGASAAPARPRPQEAVVAAAARPQARLHIRIAAASPAAVEELSSRLIRADRSESIQVSAFRQGWDLAAALRALGNSAIEILSTSHVTVTAGRPASIHAGAPRQPRALPAGARQTIASGVVRVQFLPVIDPQGGVRLRVQPEITLPQGEGVSIRRMETEIELSDGQSFLALGFLESRNAGAAWERLFPGRKIPSGERELLVLGTLELIKPVLASRQTVAWAGKEN